MAGLTVLQDEDRRVAVCRACERSFRPGPHTWNRWGAEGKDMAGKQQGGKFADRYPGAKPIGGGEMIQWTKVGQEVVGEFIGVKPFKNGHIGNVLTEEGLVAFSAPVMLAGALEQVSKGSKIAIVFASEKPNKGKGPDGKPLSATKLFEVYELGEE